MFYFDEINGKCILKSDMLPDLEHLFTTRETFLKTKEKELEATAAKNRELVKAYLKADKIVSPQQTHSANIGFAQIGKDFYPETDALILTNKKQAVFLNFADCTPVILYDKKQHIAAVSHAGWRGTAQKIAPLTINKMQSNPQDIIAIIGPAIGKCCYEVGVEVFEQLKSTVNNFEGLYAGCRVDLKGINARQLEEIGVKQIDICPYCTCCDNDMFFSYRKENGTTNRHSAVIKL